jgi:hypothetical protein
MFNAMHNIAAQLFFAHSPSSFSFLYLASSAWRLRFRCLFSSFSLCSFFILVSISCSLTGIAPSNPASLHLASRFSFHCHRPVPIVVSNRAANKPHIENSKHVLDILIYMGMCKEGRLKDILYSCFPLQLCSVHQSGRRFVYPFASSFALLYLDFICVE